MSKHTQESWKVCHWKDDRRGFEIADRNQNRVGFDMTEANARRIVACVNACRGLPTDELEQKGLVAAVGTQLLAADDRAEGQEREIRKLARTTADAENKLADALNQRGELLAALEEAKSVLSSINTGRQHKVEVEDDEPAFWQRNEWVTWAKGEVLPMIEAAIAKAKGGEA